MAQVLYSKPFLTYPAQLSLLKQRGMKFADKGKTLHLLKRIGYYRLSTYSPEFCISVSSNAGARGQAGHCSIIRSHIGKQKDYSRLLKQD